MSITLHGLKNCDSCKKAIKYLDSRGADVTLSDVREKPPTATQLKAWCNEFGRDALVNKRSTTWRGLTDRQKNITSDAQAVALIKEFPTLMKRPVIVSGNKALLGFNPESLDELLK